MIVNLKFTDNNIIERAEYSGLMYNTKISYPENCDIVVITEGSLRRLKKLDDGNINPKHKSIFAKKTDKRNHVVYLFDQTYHSARWGGNIQYEDVKANLIQEKVFIRASFNFKITRGDRFLELLSELQKNYSKRYVIDLIHRMIDSCIKAYISKSLNDIGFIRTQENIVTISENIMRKLNVDVLSSHGIMISDLNLVLEEDSEHAIQRNEIAWNELLENR